MKPSFITNMTPGTKLIQIYIADLAHDATLCKGREKGDARPLSRMSQKYLSKKLGLFS